MGPLDKSNTVYVDTTVGELDDVISQLSTHLNSRIEKASDVFGAAYLHNQQLSHGGSIHLGTVQYALPYLDWYRVAIAGDTVYRCCALQAQVSTNLIGPRINGMYQPGTRVLVHLFRNPSSGYGIILGSVPSLVDDGNTVFSDSVVQGSGVGTKQDDHYRQYIRLLSDEGGAVDFSNNAPVDQLSIDWGIMSETGVGIHIDPFMSFIRSDELHGLWCYAAGHTTLAGYSLDVVTSCANIEYRDDEGELTYYRGESPYAWEALGYLSLPAESDQLYREVSAVDVQYEKPLAAIEPANDKQTSFVRYEEFGGYLGQCRMRHVVAPPQGGQSYYTTDFDSPLVGLFREQIGLDGSYAIQSAKQLIFAKRSLIPVPRRKRKQADQSDAADSLANENYKFAGAYGEAAEHIVHDIELADGTQQAQLVATADVFNVHAHVFNWKGLHPFQYHTGDFDMPEESDVYEELQKLGNGIQWIVPNFDQLSTSSWLPRPEAYQLKIDHRFDYVKYFALMSHLTMNDDGSIVLAGGNGETITLTGGNILLSCPGDVYLQPGKNVIALAGKDAVVRAHKSVEVTAANEAIRLKAQTDLQMLSGNGGVGGTLIENRATSTIQEYPKEGGNKINASGIVLKASESHVVALAGEIYLRTGGESAVKGPIVLDSSRGESDVEITGRSVNTYHHNGGLFKMAYMTSDKATASHSFFNTRVLLSGGITIDGSMVCNSFAYIRRGVSAPDGEFINSRGGYVGRALYPERDRQEIAKAVSYVRGNTQGATKTYTQQLKERFYRANQIGTNDVQRRVSFSLRTSQQYGTDNYQLPQSYWQALATANNNGSEWAEPEVQYQKQEPGRLPWPGNETWSSETSYLALKQGDDSLFDAQKGYAKDRRDRIEKYEKPTYGSFQSVSLKSNYKVIR